MAVLKLPLVVAPQRKEANGGIKAAGRETEQCILPLRRVAARVAPSGGGTTASAIGCCSASVAIVNVMAASD